jgi:hypothetical protein
MRVVGQLIRARLVPAPRGQSLSSGRMMSVDYSPNHHIQLHLLLHGMRTFPGPTVVAFVTQPTNRPERNYFPGSDPILRVER